MVAYLVFALIVVVLVLYFDLSGKNKVFERKLKDAEAAIRILTKKVSAFEGEAQEHRQPVFEMLSIPDASAATKTVRAAPAPRHETVRIADSVATRKPDLDALPVAASQREPDAPVAPGPDPAMKPAPGPSLWQRIEKQIAENWTGILGTVVLVLGIGFLGVYTALRMSEFYRFLMIAGFAAIMAAAFFALRRKEKWVKLSLWMRSGSGAVFLFACLGAGGIPGLHWIHNPFYGLIVLILGIAVNLYLAVAGGKQVFASLHVFLGLAALTIAPQNGTTLVIASVVALFGVALTFREKWDYHLLLSISSFFAYHTYWYFRIGGKPSLSGEQNILGIIAVSAVCVLAACVHYRKVYGLREFEKTPFMVHLINWIYFGLGLLMHLSGMKWKTLPLFAGAGVAFALARYARRLRIRWLHCTDTLIAQIITIIGVISLVRWGIDYDVVFTIVFLEVLAFTRVAVLVKENILYRAGIAASQLSGIAVVVAFTVAGNLSGSTICLRQSALTAICAIGALALHWSLVRTKNPQLLINDSVLSFASKETMEFSITGLMAGLFMLCGGVFAHNTLWLHYAVVGAACAFLVLRSKMSTNGLTAGSALLTAGLHGITWYVLYAGTELSSTEILARGLPLFLLSSAAIRWDYVPSAKARFKWFGIYLGVAHLAIMSHLLFQPKSPLIPGVCWLLLSVVLLETARFLASRYKGDTSAVGQPDRYLLHAGYALLALFFVRHILVHLQSEEYIGFLKIRFGIEALALTVFLYWAFAKHPASQQPFKSWVILHPLLPEVTALFAVLTVSVEVDKYWHPLVWMAFAFTGIVLGRLAPMALSRMKAYAVLFYWASIFQVTFLLGVYEKLGTQWYERDWILGTVAIAVQFVFLTVHHRFSPLSNVSFPRPLAKLEPMVSRLNRHRNIALFYPLLVCVALFFYWTFASSLLTLLWVLECFAVFVISIVLKEQHFRYAALVGLGMCVIRLVFFDLARSTTLTKALVFLGVGLLMLGMHALYTRFKSRLSRENADETV